jgi:hypothetical protein
MSDVHPVEKADVLAAWRTIDGLLDINSLTAEQFLHLQRARDILASMAVRKQLDDLRARGVLVSDA